MYMTKISNNKELINNVRLIISKSNNHLYVQLLDTKMLYVLSSCSTLEKNIKPSIQLLSNQAQAFLIGQEIGKRTYNLGIKKVKIELNYKKFCGLIKNVIHGIKTSNLKI